MIDINFYKTKDGKCPFKIWIEEIKEDHTQAQILNRLQRIKFGNFGDCKSVGDGIGEIRIHYGPGMRIYYAKIENTIILLLCGGDKGSQERDISKAKEYFKEYKSRGLNHGKK